MINKDIFEMADKLKGLIKQQDIAANNALEKIPDGEKKDKLKALMRSAKSGKISVEKAQLSIKKILEDAG